MKPSSWIKLAVVLGILIAGMLIWFVPHAAEGPTHISLETPDGKQTMVLTLEACPFEGAPENAYLLLISTEGDEYAGCWMMTPHGVITFTPPDKPEPRDDLAPVDPPGQLKGRFGV